MIHSQVKEVIQLYKKNVGFRETHLGFAPFMGVENSEFALYPFSGCKEYPLDSYHRLYRKKEIPIEKTGFLVTLRSEDYVEDIKKTLHSLETLFKFRKSTFNWNKDEKVLSIIGSKLWHSTPAMLSLYMSMTRLSVEAGFIDFSKPIEELLKNELKENFYDAHIFKNKNWNEFVGVVRTRKIKHNINFFKSPYIHTLGIQNFLNSGRLKQPNLFFERP